MSLPNAIKAKKMQIEESTPEALDVDISPQYKTLEVNEPHTRQVGFQVASVDELLNKLRNTGVLK